MYSPFVSALNTYTVSQVAGLGYTPGKEKERVIMVRGGVWSNHGEMRRDRIEQPTNHPVRFFTRRSLEE